MITPGPRFYRAVRAGMMGAFACVMAIAATAKAAPAALSPDDYAFVRIMGDASRTAGWQKATTLSGRLSALRSYVGAYEPFTTPVSARYVVTCYGGTIDLRHFLYGAVKVLGGVDAAAWKGKGPSLEQTWLTFNVGKDIYKAEGMDGYLVQKALWDGYLVERGHLYDRYGKAEMPEGGSANPGMKWDATPNDLPSDALGVLFAEGLMGRNGDLTIDLVAEMTAFLAPLKPVPDKVALAFSYEEIALGITPGDAKAAADPAIRTWFKAQPLVQTKKLNAKAKEVGLGALCDDVADGDAALAKAGMEVALVAEQYPLRIVRIPEKK